MKILFTGGGTGGHICPIVAIAEELKAIATERNLDFEMRYFGEPDIYTPLLENVGIRVSRVLSGKLRRYFDIRNIIDIPKFFLSFFQLLWKVFWFMPDILFSKGGTGALPVVLICRFYRIPVIIHDSDAVPGINTQISAKFAKKIFISFDSANEYFSGRAQLVGNPIRSFLLKQDIDQRAAKQVFGFDPDKPLMLIMGGSQGSERINDFILDIIDLLVKDFQVLHQTGINNFEIVKKEADFSQKPLSDEEKKRYKPVAYLENNYKEALIAADIIVSRASAGGIFEIAAFGKPSILMPLPEAAQDHQRKNAYEYSKGGAAIVIENENLTPNIFLSQAKNLIADPEKIRMMSEAAKRFAKPEAAKTIAQEIINLRVT